MTTSTKGSKLGSVLKVFAGGIVALISLVAVYANRNSEDSVAWFTLCFYLIGLWAGVAYTIKGIKGLTPR